MPVEYIGPFWYPGTDVVEREAASKGEAMERLRELLPSSQGLNCSVEHVVEVHLAPEGLVNFARERNVDLIVMGLRESAIGAAASHPTCHGRLPTKLSPTPIKSPSASTSHPR